MNDTLYWVMLKQEGKKIIAYSIGLALYDWIITWIYPIIIQSPDIEEIPKCFPSAVKRVFGVATGEEVDLSYEAYISAQLFGRLWTLLISFYGVNAANALLAQPMEQGFMAYPLSAPASRTEILNTQIGVLLTELVVVIGTTLGGIYAATAHFEIKIARWQYVRLGILAFSLSLAISAYSLLLTLLFDTAEESERYASALTFAFYGLDVVSSLSDRLSGLKYLTPFGLFRPQEILQKKTMPTRGFVILGVISGVTLILAGILFSRKDLVV
ncbi:putative membrane protein [Candidatus Desulfosporosinus infrequens]|uniref:Putative membrane protein n=1 Tax=Candidatus Desulfosporosinus infrequens TaxID=2043169 RepID=A0A2U3LES8_9FIRM|nr:putative membrane protein [Candidatus Desulfosporosinus infrequens]